MKFGIRKKLDSQLVFSILSFLAWTFKLNRFSKKKKNLTFGVIFRMYLNLLCLDSEKSRNMRIDFAGRLWRGHHASRKWATVGKTQAAPEYFFVVRISGFPGNPANGAKIRNLGSLSMSDPPFIYHDFAPFSLTANWFLPPRFLMMVHFGRRQWMKKEP